MRGAPQVAVETTAALKAAGFAAQNTSTDGAAVRWTRGMAEVDGLFPASLGRTVTDVNDDPMLASHGIQQALDRSEHVTLILADGTRGTIRRPNLVGSIVAKSAAFANTSDARPGRHVDGLIFLLSLLQDDDFHGEQISPRDVHHLTNALNNRALDAVLADASDSAR